MHLILRIVLISVLLFNVFITCAQSKINPTELKVKNDSTRELFLYQVVTKSANSIIGEIIKTTSDSLTLDSKDFGHVKIGMNQIKSIEIYNSNAGTTERYMVGANHYLIAPSTPYGLEKGEINFQNSEIFLLSGWFGVNKNLTIGGGFSILPWIEFQEQLFYLVPKLNFPITPILNASVQYTQIFQSDLDNTSLLSFSTALGKRDRHLSIGYTTPLFADGDDVSFEGALINIGGVYRTGNKFALLLDLNIPATGTGSDFVLYGFGGRFINNSSSFDFGFITFQENQGIPLPWFNYTLRIK